MGSCRGSTPTNLFVDLEESAELAGEVVGLHVRQVEVDLVLAADTHALVDADVEDLASGDV